MQWKRAVLITLAIGVPAAADQHGAAPPGMIYIPGGTFMMGAGNDDGELVTQVTLSPYYLDRTEVSVGAYKACVEAGKCSNEGLGASAIKMDTAFCNWGKPGKENHPINCANWLQANRYCKWRGARLPTEAEWEFAARGTDGRKYPWGNSEPDPTKALFRARNAKATGGTAPVESYSAGASPFGVLNMAGNVWEWVADVYAPYPGGTVRNPHQYFSKAGSFGAIFHAYRGGGWYGPDVGLPSWVRGRSIGPEEWYQSSFIGFRCAQDVVTGEVPSANAAGSKP